MSDEARRLTPLKAVRAKCLDCCGSPSAVRECPCPECDLYPLRMGKGRQVLKPIHRFCLWCNCGSSYEVRHCHIESCALHPYRFGKRPKTPETATNYE